MRQFDWEKRRPPEGWLQILRNQRRQAETEALQNELESHRQAKVRASWEANAAEKAKHVARVLEHTDQLASNDRRSRGHLRLKQTAEDVLKEELREKFERDAALKRTAQTNRSKRIEEARRVAEQAEINRKIAIQKHEREHALADSEEHRLVARKMQQRELASNWTQQLAEKRSIKHLEQKNCTMVQGEGGLALWLENGHQPLQAEQAKQELKASLESQLEDCDKFKLRAQAEEEAQAAAIRQQWQREYEAEQRAVIACENSEETKRRQADRINTWQRAEAARRTQWLAEQDAAFVRAQQGADQQAQQRAAAAEAERKTKLEAMLDEMETQKERTIAQRERQRREYAIEQAASEAYAAEKLAQNEAKAKLATEETILANDAMLAYHRAQEEESARWKWQERQACIEDARAHEESQLAIKSQTEAKKQQMAAALQAQIVAKQLRQNVQAQHELKQRQDDVEHRQRAQEAVETSLKMMQR